jgi:cytidylate kinase
MGARVICLSRAIFAGADEVALMVASQLGYRRVDEEIVALAAEKRKIDPAAVADAERRKSFFAQVFEDIGRAGGMAGYGIGYMPDAAAVPPRSDQLRSLIRQAIVETADRGDVVIVAHAASYALGGREDVLRALVTGSVAARASRLAAVTGKNMQQASESIRLSDESRADYLKRFYGVEQELPEHYDVCVSTDVLSPSLAAAQIVSAANAIH